MSVCGLTTSLTIRSQDMLDGSRDDLARRCDSGAGHAGVGAWISRRWRRVDAEIETLICGLRREHPRWGARRIVLELGPERTPRPEDRPALRQSPRVRSRELWVSAQRTARGPQE
jgi:hypothetical protein